jgi:hypothetical protein
MIYTKNGRPLTQSGNNLYSRSGRHVARLRGKKAYAPDGRYVGTLVGDRLVYRSMDSASVGSSFVESISRVGTSHMNRLGSAIMGEEPPIPD